MAKQRKTPVKTPSSRKRKKVNDQRESLGDELIRQADEGHDEVVKEWRKFMKELGIKGKPIGAKKLRERLLRNGINPADNEFSRAIIAAREE
jgi:DNA/RNA-binding domain of Phe-tRNA-synthetase-like protein